MFLPSRESTGPWAYTTHKSVMQPTGSPSKITSSVSLLLPLPTHFFPMRGEYQLAVLNKVQCGQLHFADITYHSSGMLYPASLALNC